MDKKRQEYLFDRYFEKTGTDAERQELLDWLQSTVSDTGDKDQALQELIGHAFSRGAIGPSMPGLAADRVLQYILQAEPAVSHSELTSPEENASPQPITPVRRLYPARWSAAAAILLLIVAGTWFWWQHAHPKIAVDKAPIALEHDDIVPGRNAAILTLSDGKQVILDSSARDTVLVEGSAIVANADGHLAYNPGNDATAVIRMNTLTTRRGNQYQLVLPDGTKVWLNASSSITYPTAFAEGTRTVTITGEAYFEVAKNATRPFHVKTTGLDLAVLGTSFNIDAYTDEPTVRTTLIDGSVKVIAGQSSRMLQPGQQVRVKGEELTLIPDADVEQALAWKNGLFNFKDKNLHEVMRQLSRWYNLDVQYENNVPDIVFEGEMTRNENIDFVLKTLQNFGVHFRIEEGKRLVVTP